MTTSDREPSGQPRPRSSERRTTLLGLATVAAGPIAWLAQLWLLALLGDIPCRGSDPAGLFGLRVETWWLVVSGVTGLVALVGMLAAIRLRRSDEPAGRLYGSPEGTIRFLSLLGLWSNALFLATILLGATAPLFLGCP